MRIAAGILRRHLSQKMEPSIVLELDNAVPQPGTTTFLLTDVAGTRQRYLRYRISANFVTQLVATFPSDSSDARRRVDPRDAIRARKQR